MIPCRCHRPKRQVREPLCRLCGRQLGTPPRFSTYLDARLQYQHAERIAGRLFRFNYGELEPAASTLAAPSSFGFDIVPQDTAAGALPFIYPNGYFALGFSTTPATPQDENYSYFDNFSKVAGNHSLNSGLTWSDLSSASVLF